MQGVAVMSEHYHPKVCFPPIADIPLLVMRKLLEKAAMGAQPND